MGKPKKLKPRRMIVGGFLSVILIGSLLLLLPVSLREGVDFTFLDSLFTSTSAVCVTGLVVVDTGTSFTPFGQAVIAMLIQIGGLGITSIGVLLVLVTGGRIGLGKRRLVKEALNLASGKGLLSVLAAVLYVTLAFEGLGAVLSYFTFSRDFETARAIGISIFHSIASFNNAGFDVFGDFKSLADYRDNVWLNLVTAALIIFGGLGFYVISEIVSKRRFKKLSLHSKVVISTTTALILAGTLLLKITEGSTWLSAFFHSVSARTAGFASESMGSLTNAGVLVLIVLMFIGASPGSTGGGIKTTTFFVLVKNYSSVAFNKHCNAFRRKIPDQVIFKAFVVTTLALGVILVSSFLISVLNPQFTFAQIAFEIVSAFGTVGLSTGITPELSGLSKLVVIATMFIGRLGPLTMATIWLHKEKPAVSYTEEEITIG